MPYAAELHHQRLCIAALLFQQTLQLFALLSPMGLASMGKYWVRKGAV
ncbi:hypothetical protein [Thiothrix nivea]|nr:hypothetical protein [Thiothrix nivea]